MKIEENKTLTRVYPFPDDTFHSIEVWKPFKSCLEHRLNTVISWGTFGAVTADKAEAYAMGILEACRLAKEYTQKFAEDNK